MLFDVAPQTKLGRGKFLSIPLKMEDTTMTVMSFITFPLPTLLKLSLKSYAEGNFNSSPMDVFHPVAKLRSSTCGQLNFVLQLEPNGYSADWLTPFFLPLVDTIAV